MIELQCNISDAAACDARNVCAEWRRKASIADMVVEVLARSLENVDKLVKECIAVAREAWRVCAKGHAHYVHARARHRAKPESARVGRRRARARGNCWPREEPLKFLEFMKPCNGRPE